MIQVFIMIQLKEITEVFNKAPFDYPKPVGLIKFLVNYPNKKLSF